MRAWAAVDKLHGITVVWQYRGRLRASTWPCRAPGEVALMEVQQ